MKNFTFKYTREAISVIVDDLKKYGRIFKYGSLIFTTLYFIYALITKSGYFVANVILASMFVVYTVFEFATNNNKNIKGVKRSVKRSYKWIKLTIKAFTLGSLLYGVYTATTNVSAFSTIIATLMVIMWVVQLLLEVVIEVIENKVDLVTTAFAQDWEDIKDTVKDTVTAPITFVTNSIKKLKGEEIEVVEEPKRNKKIQMLYDRIEEKREAKKQAKNKDSKAKN